MPKSSICGDILYAIAQFSAVYRGKLPWHNLEFPGFGQQQNGFDGFSVHGVWSRAYLVWHDLVSIEDGYG